MIIMVLRPDILFLSDRYIQDCQAEGDLQFTSSGAKIMKMKMECTLPKAGCMEMWVTKFGSKSLQSIVSPVIKLISQSNANKKSCSRFH